MFKNIYCWSDADSSVDEGKILKIQKQKKSNLN